MGLASLEKEKAQIARPRQTHTNRSHVKRQQEDGHASGSWSPAPWTRTPRTPDCEKTNACCLCHVAHLKQNRSHIARAHLAGTTSVAWALSHQSQIRTIPHLRVPALRVVLGCVKLTIKPDPAKTRISHR